MQLSYQGRSYEMACGVNQIIGEYSITSRSSQPEFPRLIIEPIQYSDFTFIMEYKMLSIWLRLDQYSTGMLSSHDFEIFDSEIDSLLNKIGEIVQVYRQANEQIKDILKSGKNTKRAI